MPDVLTLRWIHILSAIVLFGTGLGTAFHGLAGNLSGDVRAMAVANRNVVHGGLAVHDPGCHRATDDGHLACRRGGLGAHQRMDSLVAGPLRIGRRLLAPRGLVTAQDASDCRSGGRERRAAASRSGLAG